MTKLAQSLKKSILIVIALLVVGAGGVYVFTFARASTAQGALALTVDSSKQNRVGQIEPINIPVTVTTDGDEIYGIDISMTYSPSVLELIDVIPFTGASTLTQYLPHNSLGTFDKSLVLNTAKQSGLIEFSVLAMQNGVPTTYTGSTIVATLVFKPVSEGTAQIAWNAVLGQTDDSNIVAKGTTPVDILVAAPSSSIAVLPAEATVPTPTFTPQPTATSVPPTPTNTPRPTATSTPIPTATRTPIPTATATRTPSPTNTATPTSTRTPTPTATLIPTQLPTLTPKLTITPTPTTTVEKTVTFNITSGLDDVYQDNFFAQGEDILWVGRGLQTRAYSGFRFTNVSIPKNSTITGAYLEMRAANNSWISVDVNFAFENTSNSAAFANNRRPSGRSLTSSKIRMNNNIQWNEGTTYRTPNLSSSLQQLVNRADWGNTNTVSLIGVGSGGMWGRKQITSFEGSASNAPRLVVTYR